jgi:hypothetical protein
MIAVISLASRSRKSLSNTGRKKGSKRRSRWIRKSSKRAIPFSRKLPVSGGGNPKPVPRSELVPITARIVLGNAPSVTWPCLTHAWAVGSIGNAAGGSSPVLDRERPPAAGGDV